MNRKTPIPGRAATLLALSAALTSCSDGTGQAIVITELEVPAPSEPTPQRSDNPEDFGWELMWADEFDADTVDSQSWNYETGDGSQYGLVGWGNNELQWYEEDNGFIEDGKLIIVAQEESSNGYNFTSARLQTRDKFDVKYGRIEASIKLPEGQGTWPAFWMLPTDSPYGDWAASGEIDIMEATNLGVNDKNTIIGTTHFGALWPLNQFTAKEFSPSFTVSEGFHRYAVEWQEGEIRWYIDNIQYAVQTKDNFWTRYWAGMQDGFQQAPNGPFDQSFYLLLNVAIGGNLPGAPDDTTAFPLQMEVEYVRVYQCPANPETGAGCASNINASIQPPEAASPYDVEYPLYTDGADTLSWPGGEAPVERALTAAIGWDNGGAMALSEPDMGGDRGRVLELNTSASGNVVIYPSDQQTAELFGMGSAAVPWAPHMGELIFDLYINSSATDMASQLAIKMDSGWPNLGQVVMDMSDFESDAWQTVHVKVTDILNTPNNGGANPLDIDNVLNLFVIEPTSAAHIMVDNIRLKCTYPSEGGCGIRGPEQVVESQEQYVYQDGIDPLWDRGIGAWDARTGFDYSEGNNDDYRVTWQEVDDGNGGTYLTVSFDEDGSNTGVFYIQSLSQIDLSAFSTGEISFDIRVTDYGTNTSGMAMKIDCFFPCTSGDQALGIVGDGSWQTVTVSIAQLVSSGLDLSGVNTGLVIFPTAGDQGSVTFDLDNIVWRVGDAPDVPPGDGSDLGESVLIYDGTHSGDVTFTPELNGISMTEMVDDIDADKGNVLEFNYQINETTLPFFVDPPGSTVDLSNFSNGFIEFDMLLVTEPDVGLNNTNFYVKFDSGYPRTTSAFAIAPPTLNTWTSYRISVADLLSNPVPDWEQPVVISAVDAAFVVAPDWGTAAGTRIRLDNIRWVR